MKLFDNLFNLNIQRLILKGEISKAYEKMYELAEKIAHHEMFQRKGLIIKNIEKRQKDKFDPWVYSEEVAKYKEKRIQYHLAEMKELLKLREQLKEDKK